MKPVKKMKPMKKTLSFSKTLWPRLPRDLGAGLWMRPEAPFPKNPKKLFFMGFIFFIGFTSLDHGKDR
jgi:hypothetical protein